MSIPVQNTQDTKDPFASFNTWQTQGAGLDEVANIMSDVQQDQNIHECQVADVIHELTNYYSHFSDEMKKMGDQIIKFVKMISISQAILTAGAGLTLVGGGEMMLSEAKNTSGGMVNALKSTARNITSLLTPVSTTVSAAGGVVAALGYGMKGQAQSTYDKFKTGADTMQDTTDTKDKEEQNAATSNQKAGTDEGAVIANFARSTMYNN